MVPTVSIIGRVVVFATVTIIILSFFSVPSAVVVILRLLLGMHLLADYCKYDNCKWNQRTTQYYCQTCSPGVVAIECTTLAIGIQLIGHSTKATCRHKAVLLFESGQVVSIDCNCCNIAILNIVDNDTFSIVPSIRLS